jgi:hypothetical protein
MNDPNLPRGYWSTPDEWGYDDDGAPIREHKCECGVTITMGKDDHPEYHSDYCPIYERWKEYGY